jgi:hypothetical protein
VEPTPDIVRIGAVRIRAVRFRDEQSKVPVPFEGSVLDLVGAHHASRVEKKGTPAFSPVEYRPGSSRGKRGILHATALVLDFDHLTSEAAEDVARRLRARGWAWFAYTSWSHQADGADDCCFRVVVVVSRPILPEEYEAVWVAANVALGRVADANARDVSRIWFVASCPPERLEHAWVKSGDGRPLDVDKALAASALKPKAKRARRRRDEDSTPLRDGERNAGLASIGGALRRKGAGRDELLAALGGANEARCTPPLVEAEVERIVDSLLRYDPASPLLTLNLSDAGNAERLRAHVGERFAYVHAWGSWITYDGVRWTRDGSGEAIRAALATLRSMAAEAGKVPDGDLRGELLKHALDSESSARIGAMVALGQAMLPVGNEVLDQDPDLLNVANGTLDLRTAALRPHSGTTGSRGSAPWPGIRRPRARGGTRSCCGRWAATSAWSRSFNGPSATRSPGTPTSRSCCSVRGRREREEHVPRDAPRAARRLRRHHRLHDVPEARRRGRAQRPGAARRHPVRVRGRGRGRQAARRGAREAAHRRRHHHRPVPVPGVLRLPPAVQDLAGREPQAAHQRERPRDLAPDPARPVHGHHPRARARPEADAEADRGAPRHPRVGGPGLPGLAGPGLGLPDEVRSATDAYRDEMDVYGGFLDELCVAGGSATITAKELYEAYTRWCDSNGEKPRSQKALASGLRERGFEAAKGTKGTRIWRGLRLRREGDPAGGGWRIDGASSGYSPRTASSVDVAQATTGVGGDRPKYPEDAPPSAIRHPETQPPEGWEEGEL